MLLYIYDKFGKFPDLLRVETPAGKREEFEPNQEGMSRVNGKRQG